VHFFVNHNVISVVLPSPPTMPLLTMQKQSFCKTWLMKKKEEILQLHKYKDFTGSGVHVLNFAEDDVYYAAALTFNECTVVYLVEGMRSKNV
jgi:hypothetical protein